MGKTVKARRGDASGSIEAVFLVGVLVDVGLQWPIMSEVVLPLIQQTDNA
jgi:hypothetical protein